MPNPPYSGTCIILYENQDGINVRVYHYKDVIDGTPIPKGVIGLESSLFSALGPNDVYVHRNFATRSALKTGFGQFVDSNSGFPGYTGMTETKITGVLLGIEVSTYLDGKLAKRPQPIQVVVLESDIPDAVLEWLNGLLPKGA